MLAANSQTNQKIELFILQYMSDMTRELCCTAVRHLSLFNKRYLLQSPNKTLVFGIRDPLDCHGSCSHSRDERFSTAKQGKLIFFEFRKESTSGSDEAYKEA